MLHVRDDRDFMLLVACALLAMLALGLITAGPIETGRREASAAVLDKPPFDEDESPATTLRADDASSVQPQLRPLLSASFAERFPSLARATAAAAPRAVSLQDTAIVSYYGNPNTARMGILGAADPKEIATLIEGHAARYDALNGPAGVVPAFHLVYAVAQPHPATDGRYLYYVQPEQLNEYLRVAEQRGMLLFLDLQIGRSSVEAEVRRVLPYLRHPSVHLALDPEFAMAAGQAPGDVIGGIDAGDINRAQTILQELVEREGLPPKLLIVHQFIDSMIRGGDAIRSYPDVELIIDMDGFGPADVKRAIYRRYATRPYALNAGIKLFFQQDAGLLSEEDVLALEPRPAVVIYQ